MLSGFEPFHDIGFKIKADFPLVTYSQAIPGDFPEIMTHWHDEMEILYFRKGQGYIDIGMERHEISEGDIVSVYPGQFHKLECPVGGSLSYDVILFCLPMLYTSQNDLCTEKYLLPLAEGRQDLPNILTPEDSCYPGVLECVRDIWNISLYYPEGYPLAVKGRLFQLLYILFYYQGEPLIKTHRKKSEDNARIVLDYVISHFREKLTVETMASVSGLSESHFMKFFKTAAGVPFIEYLNDYRLFYGYTLLFETEIPILDVAKECGFDNFSYFSRIFKREFGMTPSKFRKQAAQNLPLRQ